jgi:hypothetical protein
VLTVPPMLPPAEARPPVRVVPPPAVVSPAVGPPPLAVVAPPVVPVVPPGPIDPPVAVAPARLVAPATEVCPPLPLLLPPVAATPPAPPALPPAAPGELEEEQPTRSATSRTETNPRRLRSLCAQLCSHSDVLCRFMVFSQTKIGVHAANRLPLDPYSSRRGLSWPIPQGRHDGSRCRPTSRVRAHRSCWPARGPRWMQRPAACPRVVPRVVPVSFWSLAGTSTDGARGHR